MNNIAIIAGGTSAASIDFSTLPKNVYIYAVNDAFLHIPNYDAIVSMDGRWMYKRYHILNRGLRCRLLFSRKHYDKWLGDRPRLPSMAIFDVDPEKLEMGDPIGANNSGVMAMNLAYFCKPDNLFLYGFDACNNPSNTNQEHWYGAYDWRKDKNPIKKYNDWLYWHEKSSKQFSERNVKVWNVSEFSKIEQYEKITHNQALDIMLK